MSPMRPTRTILLLIPLILIVTICYVSLFNEFNDLKSQNILHYEKRFDALRRMLPPRGVVGYISDDTNDVEDSKARLFVAQYALAPLIVVRSLDYGLVVGNFRKPVDKTRLFRDYGLIVAKDFGNGTFLLERTAR